MVEGHYGADWFLRRPVRGEARTQQRRHQRRGGQSKESAAASRHHESCTIRRSLDFVANFF